MSILRKPNHTALHTAPGRFGRKAVACSLVALIAATTVGCTSPAPSTTMAPTARFASLEAAVRAGVVSAETVSSLRSGGATEVVVQLDQPTDASSNVSEGSTDQLRADAATAATVLASVGESGDQRVEDYPHLAAKKLTIDSEERLLRLVNQPEVGELTEPLAAKVFGDAQSVPLVRQPAAATAGATGTGQVVAVVDNALEHGRNVAAIVQSMAPGATVRRYNLGQTATGALTGIEAQLEKVLADRTAGLNIRSLNLSIGGGSYLAGQCHRGWDTFLQRMSAAGIVAVAAAGNDARSTSLAAPGCSKHAIAVGATYDSNIGGIRFTACADPTTATDRVTCFSNSNADLDIVAPGAMITADGITMAGTSQASPHVAGAIAALASIQPNARPEDLRKAVLTSAVQIRDARNGVTRPRLDLEAARTTLLTLAEGTQRSDVNGDGKADLVGRTGTEVQVALSTGSAFKPATRWASFGAGYTMSLGDVNGDGKADLVGRSGGDVQVALSTGKSFAASRRWATWGAPYTMLLGDVNGDKRADLVGRSGTNVMVGLSLATSFRAPTRWSTWGAGHSLAVADVNGDNRADLVGRSGTEVRVGLSLATSFRASTRWTTWTAESMLVSDVNGDKRADLVGRAGTEVRVGLSLATSFRAPTRWSSWSAGYSLAVADVNGDKRADLVGRSGKNVQVGLSLATSFRAATRWTTWAVGNTVQVS